MSPRSPLTYRIVFVTLFGLITSFAVAQPPQPPVQPPPAAVRSKVKVIVPQPDAQLFVEKALTKTTGPVREFDTPAMEPGKRYVYDFRVTWKPNKFTTMTRTATRTFTAGDIVEVDFTKDAGNDRVEVTLDPPAADVVAELVKAANIGPNDVVFEPGSADAGLLIAAVKAGAKRAVGVQPDPAKLAAAKEQVKKEQLEGKVDIHQNASAEEKDYAEATVVFLNLGEEASTALRPVLLRDLKPGTRIVSNRFKMGDWPPTATVPKVSADGDNYEIHTWAVTEADKQKYGQK